MSEAESLTYVEIDIDYCANTYGVAPCTASIPTTGDVKCYNCVSTCQDRENFANDPVTLRFGKPTRRLPPPEEIPCIPDLISAQIMAGVVSLGQDLGQRTTVTATFSDHPHPDTGEGFDKYHAERDYNPFEQGSLWGKFRARQPYLRNRPFRLIRGQVGQDLSEMETRHYIMEAAEGPRPDGTFSIAAKDVLKLADDERAVAPLPSEGTLVADITDTDDVAELPSGMASALYPAEGYVCIGGNEVCRYEHGLGGNDSNTKLLLHGEGTDGSTTFTDASPSARGNATLLNNAQVDTSQKKFGLASILFDGFQDAIYYADHADWTFAGDFTLDCQARFASLAEQCALMGHSTNGTNQYRLFVTSTGRLQFDVISGGVTTITLQSAAGLIVINTWYHLAVVRNGNVFKIYINGVEVATVTDSDAIPNFSGQFKIGIDGDFASFSMNGWLDEVRVSNVARWTDDFTPPTSPYNDATLDDLVLVERGAFNTTPIAHKAEERVQLCLLYDAVSPELIIQDLFENYTPGFDPAWINIETWSAEVAAYLSRVYSTIITEPTGVNTLVSELVLQAALILAWDDIAANLRLRVLRNILPTASPINEDRYDQGSLTVKEQPQKRLSQCWTYYARRNPTRPLTDKDNYKSILATVDLEAETDYGQPAIKTIFSRWIPEFGSGIAERVNDIHLGRYRIPPRKFTFDLFRLNAPEMFPGDAFYIQSWLMQDASGARENVTMQLTRINPDETEYKIEAEEAIFANLDPVDLFHRVITIDANAYSLNIREIHDNLYPVITDPYGISLTIIVQPGVIVGSQSVSQPALDMGDWVPGLVPTLRIFGRVQGKGGRGAGTPILTTPNVTAEDGGVALYTRHPISLDLNTDGELWGGGGGGGSNYVNIFYPEHPGAAANHVYCGGGGGGAGKIFGAKGVAFSKLGGAPWQDDSGTDGTTEAGGTYGTGPGGAHGGAGGDPGEPGDAQVGLSPMGGVIINPPGAAGAAIDGDSYVTITVAGDLRGPQIN